MDPGVQMGTLTTTWPAVPTPHQALTPTPLPEALSSHLQEWGDLEYPQYQHSLEGALPQRLNQFRWLKAGQVTASYA